MRACGGGAAVDSAVAHITVAGARNKGNRSENARGQLRGGAPQKAAAMNTPAGTGPFRLPGVEDSAPRPT
eukprot:647051-Lingulodinium_polyedra.AAC.1